MPVLDTTGLTVIESDDWWTLYDNGLLYVYCQGDMESALGSNDFDDASAVTQIYVEDGVTGYNWGYVFHGLENVTSIRLPSGFTLGYSNGNNYDNFGYCQNLPGIIFPSGITCLPDGTLYSCSSLTYVVIPSTVTEVDYSCFDGCSSLADIYFTGTESQWNEIEFESPEFLQGITIHYNSSGPPAQAPTITIQPTGANYIIGDTASPLSISASSIDGGELSYQWYRNTTNSTIGGTAVSGAASASHTPDISAVGTVYYYAAVTNSLGQNTASETSNVVAIVVSEPPLISVIYTGDSKVIKHLCDAVNNLVYHVRQLESNE